MLGGVSGVYDGLDGEKIMGFNGSIWGRGRRLM
jgi:hypothetical protein